MKKLFMIGAVISLVASSTMVFAETKKDSVEVSYTVPGGYTLTIPAELGLVTENPVEKALSVTNVRLASTESLTVTMESANYTADATNKYHVKYETSIIPYTVTADGTEVTENNVELIDIQSGTTGAEVKMTFTTTKENIEGAKQAGKHVDTLTFTAAVVTE